jgi:EAL domain-containing protein (putative c-di-GMP-specific phosphodiesterase class I)
MRDAGDAIAVDEAGLSFGILGSLRLKAAYRPIFARRDSTLRPIGVSATLVMQLHGRTLGDEDLQNLTEEGRILSLRLGRRLAISNLASVCDEPDFGLLLDLSGDIGAPGIELDALLAQASRAGIEPRSICFDLAGLHRASCLGSLMARVRKAGSSCAFDLAMVGRQRAEKSAAAPRLVRVPAGVMRIIIGDAESLRRFGLLVTALRRRGTMVQMEGITDPILLRAALAAGADRLQGDYLGGPALAGTAFDHSPRILADLIEGSGGNVLFA